jgi:protein SCO1/2
MPTGCTPTPQQQIIALAALLAFLPNVGMPSDLASNRAVPPVTSIDPTQAMRVSQGAIGRQIGNYHLTDQFGRPLELARLRGRPLIISFIYTSCASACPTLTTRLSAVAKVAREALGKDSFSILTVGFDARVDTAEQMRRYAHERGIDMPGWYFAATDQSIVDRLAADTGFVYAPAAGGYDHFSQLTIVDARGRVFRQVYGQDFEPPLIVEPLKTLVLGSAATASPGASWLSAVRLICTTYDPKSGRYRFDYSLILEIIIGLMCTLAIAIFVVRAWNQTRASDGAS